MVSGRGIVVKSGASQQKPYGSTQTVHELSIKTRIIKLKANVQSNVDEMLPAYHT